MLLMFGQATVNTKGLPRISVINSQSCGDRTVYVAVRLASGTRAAVEKWAKRLGVEVTEGDGWRPGERHISAEAESDGSRLHVYTYVPVAPGEVPAVDGKGAGLPATIAAVADPDTVMWVVDPKADTAGGVPC